MDATTRGEQITIVSACIQRAMVEEESASAGNSSSSRNTGKMRSGIKSPRSFVVPAARRFISLDRVMQPRRPLAAFLLVIRVPVTDETPIAHAIRHRCVAGHQTFIFRRSVLKCYRNNHAEAGRLRLQEEHGFGDRTDIQTWSIITIDEGRLPRVRMKALRQCELRVDS